jgi:glycosyltransferase involved in cell wall biosynthesis
MPYFSIIIPSFNRANIIENAIKVVLGQSFQDFELLIVDDGSTDHTQAIVKPYLKDQRIQYIYQKNKGVCAARNQGALNSTGDYLIFFDSDDEVEETWLEDFYNIKDYNYDIIFCQMKRIDKKYPNGFVVNPKDKKFGAIGNGIVIPGAFMIKKIIFDKVGGYDESLFYAENTELFFRINKLKPSRFFIDKVNFIYYPSEYGGSKNLMNMIISNKIILEKHDDWLSNKIKYTYHQIIAVNYTRFDDQRNAAFHFMKAIKYNPFKLGTYIRFLISKSSYLRSVFYKLNFKK